MGGFTYKNISDQDQSLIGFGVVEKGEEIRTDKVVNNPNFKRVEKREFSKKGK